MADDVKKDSTAYLPVTAPFTYYTEDYKDYVDFTANSEYLIDGTKYEVVAGGPNVDLSINPAKSVELVRGKGYATLDGNKSVSETFAGNLETLSKDNVTFKGPEDTSVVWKKVDVVKAGGEKAFTYTANIWGVKTAGVPGNLTNKTAADGETAETIFIGQVSSDVAGAVTFQNNTDSLAKVSAVDGVDYYAVTTAGAVTRNYYANATAKITKTFEEAAQGKKSGVAQLAPTFTADDAIVWASKGIKTTVNNVNKEVTIQGEISSTVTNTDSANGTRTWVVNGGVDVNEPVYAYRFVNLKTNEHLYTIVPGEIANLIASADWKLENPTAFKVLPYNTTVSGAVPVRRYRNNVTGEFLYSTDASEQANLDKNPTWTREGIAFCGANPVKGYAVTRIVSTKGQGHAYCTSVENEVKPQVATGNWKQEGVPFFAVDIPANEK